MINFKELLEVQSYTNEEKRMNKYLLNLLKNMENVVVETQRTKEGTNIYITKNPLGVSSVPCIVAHTDTVHPIVEDLTCLEINGCYTGFNKVKMTQTGIGGDDKVGIYVALVMLEELEACKVAFFCAEESGCNGSALADNKFFDDCRFILQCDRKGNKDFVTEIYNTEISSEEWQDDIKSIIENHGYSFTDGGLTDVYQLKENGVTCPVANMSCGYYNPHMSNEYISKVDVFNVISLVREICTKITKQYYHKAEYKRYSRGYDNYSFNQSSYDSGDIVGNWIYLPEYGGWYALTDVYQDAFNNYIPERWAIDLLTQGYEDPYEYLEHLEGDTEVHHSTCEVCYDFISSSGECPTCNEALEKGIDLNWLR